MSTTTVGSALRPTPIPSAAALRGDPVVQAFTLLRIAFTVAPILFGLDKFAGVLTDDWTRWPTGRRARGRRRSCASARSTR